MRGMFGVRMLAGSRGCGCMHARLTWCRPLPSHLNRNSPWAQLAEACNVRPQCMMINTWG